MDKDQILRILQSQAETISYFKEKSKELEVKLREIHKENEDLRKLLKENIDGSFTIKS